MIPDEPLTERRVLDYLVSGDVSLPPLEIRVQIKEIWTPQDPTHASNVQLDAIIDVSWQSKTQRFIVECRALSTPKVIETATAHALQYSQLTGMPAMICVPYLSPDALARLEASGVSGIDLSGNGVVIVPGKILVYRTGAPNRFPSRRKGPNPYRGASSQVARTLAMRSEFGSARELEEFMMERGGTITQSTISKALDELEEDLIITRRGRSLRVLKYDELLNNLVRNHDRPDTRDMRNYKVNGSPGEVARFVVERAREFGEPIMVTGLGSASHYTAMVQSPPLPIYCPRLDLLDGHADAGSRFPNIRVIRMPDLGAYYDARIEDGWPWASPVQTFIELMNGGPRDLEMADQVRQQFVPDADSWPNESEITNSERTAK